MGTRQDTLSPEVGAEARQPVIKLRGYQWDDFEALKRIFAKQGLPDNCLPDITIHKNNKTILNPRFVVKKVVEDEAGNVGMMGFLRITSEAFLIIDHSVKDPAWRWMALQEMVEDMAAEAKRKGIDVVTAWLPESIVPTFGTRLEALQFVRSPWCSYSRLL